jgi:hypothetical protein
LPDPREDLRDLVAEQVKLRQETRSTSHTTTTPPTATQHAAAPNPAPTSTTTAPASAAALPAATGGQPCHDATMFVANIGEWSVPPSCYADIYAPNPADYVTRPSFGYCDWWPLVLNPNEPDLLDSSAYKRGTVPIPGAVVYEAPGVQGAGPYGHYAQVVAVAPGGYWMLITEMNFSWRGGGFGYVDYRYIHVGSGITFIYP